MPSVDLIQILTNGGFAALFVWLLYVTRTESQQRETRLLALLDKYAEKLDEITHRLECLTDSINDIDKRLPRDSRQV